MRRLSVFITLLFFAFSNVAYGQRFAKEVASFFSTIEEKSTMVVLPSTSLEDLMLRDAVTKGWKLGPYQFCTMEEYKELKGDSTYLFLMRVDGQYKKDHEAQIEYLTLFSGGREVKQALFSSQDIITLPLQQFDSFTGETLDLLPIYIDVIQEYLLRAKHNVTVALKQEIVEPDALSILPKRELLLSLSQLNYTTYKEELEKQFNWSENVKIVSDERIEEALAGAEEGVVIPLLVKPRDERSTTYCYKLLVEPATNKLLFFRKHRVNFRRGIGFTREDIRTVSTPYHF